VGITELVDFEKISGGEKISVKKPKCDLIKSHTARRTGATLMYRDGISIRKCMAITGHATEKMFLSYVKTGIEETAEDLSTHDYFNKPLMKKA
jgi:integrase